MITLKKILMLAALAAGLFGFYLLSVYSFLEIKIPDETAASITITNQQSHTSQAVEAKGNLRRLVRRGSYEVRVTVDDKHYFAVARASGFGRTTPITAALSPANHQHFVGDNPSPCMYFADALLSYGCGSSYSRARVHKPATDTQPTYLAPTPSPREGYIEGIVRTAESNVIILQAPPAGEDEGPPHSAYILEPDFNLVDGVKLEGLEEDTTYSFAVYKEGFIAYDNSYERVFYYKSRVAAPEELTLLGTENDNFRPYAISASGDTIARAYSTAPVASDGDDNASLTADSLIVVNASGSPKSYAFKERYGVVKLCGKERLCLLQDQLLEVYDISGTKQRKLFEITNVRYLETLGGELLVVTDIDVLLLDPSRGDGFVSLGLKDYQFCGIQTQSTSYVLCLINSSQKKVALMIDTEKPDTDNISHKISELLGVPEISSVSIYGSFVYISPRAGSLVYDSSAGGFGYDQNILKQSSSAIESAISRLGINRTNYTIKNTAQP